MKSFQPDEVESCQAIVKLRTGWVTRGSIRWLLGLCWIAAAIGAAAQSLISPTNQVWRYFASNTGPALDWASPTFDDSSWPEGRGLFGKESNYPYPVATPIIPPTQGGPVTAYFRTHFTWTAGWVNSVTLKGTNFVDDGCVIYLNGVEISRYNMPAGEPGYDTLAVSANPGGYPNLTGGEPVMVRTEINLSSLTNGNSNPLRTGDNVLAVEVHNSAQSSSDTMFGLSLFAGIDDWIFCLQPGSPTNRTIIEGDSTTFQIEAFCPSVVSFQWYRNTALGEELIPGATANTYTLNDVVITRDTGIYYCRLTGPTGTVESRHALLVVLPDDSSPFITSASARADGSGVTLGFSKRLNPTSAENPENYTFTPPLEVLRAILSNEATSATVALVTTPALSSVAYTLHVADLTDNLSPPNWLTPNPTHIPLTSVESVLSWSAPDWNYTTNTMDGSPSWKLSEFVPGTDWSVGRGLFGTETTPATLVGAPAAIDTFLPPNDDPAAPDARVTTYFRRQISLPPIPAGSRYMIRHFADDGFIAYLDGVEIHRFAMPAGAVSFATRSTGIPTGDATLRSFTFDGTAGTHTLAVELHQAEVNSPDVLFGMEISVVNSPIPGLSIHPAGPGAADLRWNADVSWQLRAAHSVEGPYLDALIQPRNPLGHFTIPASFTGNTSQFFRLDYVGPR